MDASLALALAAVWVWMGVQGLFWRADFSAFFTGYDMILDGRGDRPASVCQPIFTAFWTPLFSSFTTQTNRCP